VHECKPGGATHQARASTLCAALALKGYDPLYEPQPDKHQPSKQEPGTS
jgi:hypothetical protein